MSMKAGDYSADHTKQSGSLEQGNVSELQIDRR